METRGYDIFDGLELIWLHDTQRTQPKYGLSFF